MREDYKKLRTSLLNYTNSKSAGEVAALDLFAIIKDYFAGVVSCDDEKKIAFFTVMENVQDLYAIDAIQTTELLRIVCSCIENELGSSAEYPSWMGWQMYSDQAVVQVICEFVKKNAVWCITHDNSSDYVVTKALIKILPFNHEEFLVDDLRPNCNLKEVLERNSYHTVIVSCLVSSPYDWMRWPEFIWARLKKNRISRDWLAQKLEVKGLFRKMRVVCMVKRRIKQQNRQQQKKESEK